MKELLGKCLEPTVIQRFVRSHTPVPGEEQPRPCDVPGCKFGHGDDAAAIVEALSELLAMERKLSADESKKGKAAFSKWRMAHAASHFNVQPGEYGKPMFWHDFCDQILDALHLAELGLPKTPWKHGILNNASDDAREAISEQLKLWKHPLDTRRKDDNRVRAAKWFTGEKWHSFCAGESGSPGGPVAMATLVLIIADDMQQRGVEYGAGAAAAVAAPAAAVAAPAAAPATATQQPKPKGGRGRAAFGFANAARAATTPSAPAIAVAQLVTPGQEDPKALQAARAQLRHVPSALQLAADPADIAVIKKVFGSRAQTIINTLLAWDALSSTGTTPSRTPSPSSAQWSSGRSAPSITSVSPSTCTRRSSASPSARTSPSSHTSPSSRSPVTSSTLATFGRSACPPSSFRTPRRSVRRPAAARAA